ncbi:DUF1573 domain-containing protein, partial [Candidatus Poribacteria bacterium]|nr:DUF1573 domain-containing protein [Candidatus Poribacteria bacterium]
MKNTVRYLFAIIVATLTTTAVAQLTNTKIAFQSDRSGTYGIYVMDPDGANQTPIILDTSQNQHPSWSPDGSKLAFVSLRDGNYEIYVADADGSNQTNRTNHPTASDDFASWSPDGTKIAFQSNRAGLTQIYVMNADGTNVTLLPNSVGNDYAPVWSPGGTKIAFYSNRDGNDEIYVVDIVTESLTNLTNNGTRDRYPSWSPDGTRIAFERDYDVYVMDADGLNPSNLTSSAELDYSPRWSPDGTKIVMMSERPTPGQVYTMDANGANQTPLTSTGHNEFPSWSPYLNPVATTSVASINAGIVTKPGSGTATFAISNTGGGTLTVSGITSSNGQFAVSPAPPYNLTAGQSQTVTVTFTPTKVGWEQSALSITHNASGSPSTVTAKGIGRINPPTGDLAQTKIAFTSNRDGNGEVYVMSADGSGQVRLTNNSAIDEGPAWSPDGTKIAFQSTRDGHYEIYVMNADGTAETRLTTSAVDSHAPAWSPDGTRIAFARGTNVGDTFIYVMDADGSNVNQLTSSGSAPPGQDPSWSPDGTKIAFGTYGSGADIYVMNANGSNVVNVTNTSSSYEVVPSWSPDGTKLAFHTNRDGNNEIYAMGADGANPTRLTSDPGADEQPDWSPDGTKIAWSTNRNGTHQIYVMNTDGTSPTRITTTAFIDGIPSWSPFLAPALPSYQNWQATLRLTGDPAGDHTVIVGVAPDATDAVNLSLEDTLAPPMPQPPASWLRLLRGGQALSQDVLAFADARTWTIEVEVGSGTHYLSIEGLPEGVLAYYNDNPRIVHGPDTDAATAVVHPLPLGASIPLNTGRHLLTLVLSKRLPQTLATTLGIRWRMFSLPGPTTNGAPADLVTRGVISMYGYGYFDASTPPVWIENYQQVTLASTQPLPFVGKGWFIFRDPANGPLATTFQVDVGDPAAQSVSVTLQPRWNLVGAPFGGAPASAYNPTAKTVFGYDGVNYVIATSLSQFQGYWVYNELATARTVTITQPSPGAPAIVQRAAPSPDWVAP